MADNFFAEFEDGKTAPSLSVVPKATAAERSTYPLGGFNAAQLERIFEQIACSAGVARDIAAYAAQGGHGEEAMSQFHALKFMLERIGALAEAVVPGTVQQTPMDWILGPGFSQLKEASHG